MAVCFVSFTEVDRPWAEWIADVMRSAGHEIILQTSDFLPGENFVLRMQTAAAAAEHTIVVLSNKYLSSGFAAAEWAAAFANDPTGSGRVLIPVAIEPVAPPGLWRAIIRVELFGKSEQIAKQMLLSAIEPVPPVRAPFPDDPRVASTERSRVSQLDLATVVEVWRLPVNDGLMIGRREEFDALNKNWDEPSTNVVTIVGWGGSGKTTLLNRWLATMAAAQYRGAERVFAWSFDSQATGGQVATSDQFIDGALSFFGADGSRTASIWERCRQVTSLFQQTRTLLILDGLDRLQEPPGRHGGSLREPAMAMLVRELAAFNNGMCVITTRVPVADIKPFLGHTAANVSLGSLSLEEGARLLIEDGVVGETAVVEETALEARCHPLTLRLLGSYVRTVYNGDLRRWRTSGLAATLEQAGDDTAGRVMDEYAAWFAQRPESQILTAIGLFDRPASTGELRAIRSAPIVPGLNSLLADLTDVQWAYAVSDLASSGLVTLRSDERDALDAHPLVRSHFGLALRSSSEAAFQEGHRRLYQYLSSIAEDHPRDLAESIPLLSAVWHGTQAGLAALMPSEIYWPRLAQDSHQLRDVLGAAAANHEVLSYIVDAADIDGSALSQVELARILCDQALDLRMLGRPRDAISPLQRAAVAAAAANDDEVAANALRHLAQLQLTLGDLGEARSSALAATSWARRLTQSHLENVATKLTLADVESHIGNQAEAKDILGSIATLFDDGMLRRYAHRATLYISAFRAVEIATHAHDGGEDTERLGDLTELTCRLYDLNEGTRSLSLPRALMRLASAIIHIRSDSVLSTANEEIDAAISEIRESSQRPWLIQALLVQASVSRTLKAFDAASTSLREARSLCVTDGMIIVQLDCDFEAARIELARGNDWQGKIMLDSLAASAARIGYARLAGQLSTSTATGRAASQLADPGRQVEDDVDGVVL